MAYNDFVQNIQNADTDAQALSKFMQGANSEVVKRRIANDIKTLQYYIDYLHGLELVYSQTDGTVNVNGAQVKTVTQAIKDAINTAGVANGVNANLVIYGNRTQADKNSDFITVKDYGAIGDGTLHPLSERFATLADAQKKYPHATSLNDSIDWAALQQAINNYNLSKRAIYLADFKLCTNRTLEVKNPIVMLGASNLGWGSAIIYYSGNDTAIRFKRDNFTFNDYSKWIYGASVGNFSIQGIGGNAKKAIELWGCSECCFDKLTIGGSSDSRFKTGFELNGCSINTFKNVVGSYNDVMYDFKINPDSRWGYNASTHITGGDYYDNKTMFSLVSVSGLYVRDLWVESCDNILIADDTNTGYFEIDNVFFDDNYFLMNTATSSKTIKILNKAGNKSRILSMHFNKNVLRYNNSQTWSTIPVDIKSFETSNGYNIFDVTLSDNKYYGFGDALTYANATQIKLNLINNKNIESANFTNTIKDATPDSVFTGVVQSQLGNSLIIGHSNKTRNSASLVIDNENGDVSSLAIYQKQGVYSPLFSMHDSKGNIVSSFGIDGSASLSFLTLKNNRIHSEDGALSYGSNLAGDVVINNTVSSAKPVTNWTCVTSGTPGVWQQSAHIVTTGATVARPVLSATDKGVMYFDTTLAANGKPVWWTGSKWVDASGNQV